MFNKDLDFYLVRVIGGVKMKRVTNFQIVIGFFVVFVAFIQAYNHWGERELLSYFFLIGGLGILVLNLIALYKKVKSKDSTISN
jgi:hypothetical protein